MPGAVSFRCKTTGRYQVPPADASDGQINPIPAFGGIQYMANGEVIATTTSGPTNQGRWFIGPPPPGAQIFVSIAGTTPSGSALNTWINLSSQPGWSLTQFGPGFAATAMSVQLRDAAGNVRATGTNTLNVVVS